MKTFFEILARFIIAMTNIILLFIAEPQIGDVFPELGPYSLHITFVGIVVLTIWIVIPLADFMFGFTHRHETYVRSE